jgi:hypothetical protein
MEIDEHLKYTLYVFPAPHDTDRLLADQAPACNSTRARELVNPWSLGVSHHSPNQLEPTLTLLQGPPTTSSNESRQPWLLAMQPLGAGTSLEKEVVWPYADGDALPKPVASKRATGMRAGGEVHMMYQKQARKNGCLIPSSSPVTSGERTSTPCPVRVTGHTEIGNQQPVDLDIFC